MVTTGIETTSGGKSVDLSDRANLITELYASLGIFDPETAEQVPDAVRLALEELHRAHSGLTDTQIRVSEANRNADGVSLPEVVSKERMYVHPVCWDKERLVVVRLNLAGRTLSAIGMFPDYDNEFEEPGLTLTDRTHAAQVIDSEGIISTINHNNPGIRAMPSDHLAYIIGGLLRQEEGLPLPDQIYTATRFPNLDSKVAAVGSKGGKIGLWPSHGTASPNEGFRTAAVIRDEHLSS